MPVWIEHSGGPQPVSSETRVTVRFRSGHEGVSTPTFADRYDWDFLNEGSDIVAYRVHNFERELVQKYVDDAMSLRRTSQRHRRIGWHDSANGLWTEAKSRLGLAKMWAGKTRGSL